MQYHIIQSTTHISLNSIGKNSFIYQCVCNDVKAVTARFFVFVLTRGFILYVYELWVHVLLLGWDHIYTLNFWILTSEILLRCFAHSKSKWIKINTEETEEIKMNELEEEEKQWRSKKFYFVFNNRVLRYSELLSSWLFPHSPVSV